MLKPTPLNRVPAGSARRSKVGRVLLAVWRIFTHVAISLLQTGTHSLTDKATLAAGSTPTTGVFLYTRARAYISKVNATLVGCQKLIPSLQSQLARLTSSATLRRAGFALTLLVTLAAGLVLRPANTSAATNSTINFQARLQTNTGAIAPDGSYNVEFKLYSASSGGTALWTEDDVNSTGHGLSVSNGYLTAALGSVTAFPTTINWDQQLYLTMNIGGTSTGSPTYDGEMSPRLALTSVPFAFRAGSLAQYNATSGFTSTLSVAAPTGGAQTFTVPDQGAAGSYTLLTTNTANSNYIQDQSGVGTPQGGGFNVGGNGTIGGNLSVIGSSSTLSVGTASPSATFQVANQTSSRVAAIIQGASSQSVDLLEFQDSNGIVASKFNSSGQLTLGTLATSGTVYKGQLTLSDGTTDGYGVTLQSATLSHSTTLNIPYTTGTSNNYVDTLCLQTLSNCGVSSIGSLDGPSISNANSNGATISGASLYLQSASTSYPGLVNITTQTLTGAKTFNSQLSATASGTGLAVTNNATIGGTLAVTGLVTGGTYNGQTISSSANFTGSVTVQGTSGLTLGVSGTTTGSLYLANAGSTVLIQSASQSGAYTFTIPTTTASDNFCLQNKGNCTGSSAGSGDTNYIFNSGTTAVQQTANINILSSATGSNTTATATIQAASSGNADILDLVNKSGSLIDYFTADGGLRIGYGSGNLPTVALGGTSNVSGTTLNIATYGTGANNQNALVLQSQRATTTGGTAITVENSANGVISYLDFKGNLVLGQAGGSTSGTLSLADGTGDGYLNQIVTAGLSLSSTQTFTLPTTGGTLCVAGASTASSCTASGTGFIQNQVASPQTGGFNVSGNAIVGGTLSLSTPTASASSSLLALGNNISGGNSSTNGGTFIGLNEASSGSGSAADFLNFQVNGTAKLLVDNSGDVKAAGVYYDAGTAGATTTCSGGQVLQNQVVIGGIVTGGTCGTVGGSGSGVSAIGALDGPSGNVPNANGATIVSTTEYLQSASTSNPGLVNNTTQSFSGNKTFSGSLTASSGLTVSGLTTASGGLTIGVGATGESSPQLLVLDNGTTSTDPTGVTGAMYYSTYYSEYRCYTEGGWQSCRTQPIDASYEIDEEFISGSTTTSAAAAATGIGNYNWTDASTTAAAGCAFAYTGGTSGSAVSAARPGILKASTSTATTGLGCNVTLGPQTSTPAGTMLLGASQDLEASVAVGSTTGNVVRVGNQSVTLNSSAQTITSGVWWEANPSSSTYWRYCYAMGSATNCAASTVSIAANTFVRLEIQILSSSSIAFTINGTTTTLTGISPSFATTVEPDFTCYNGTAATSSCYIDYYQLRADESTLR